MDNAKTARNKLRTIRQKVSVANYCAKFDTLVISLPESSVGDLIHAFIFGLKSNFRPLVKAQVAQKEAPSLAEAMTVAV